MQSQRFAVSSYNIFKKIFPLQAQYLCWKTVTCIYHSVEKKTSCVPSPLSALSEAFHSCNTLQGSRSVSSKVITMLTYRNAASDRSLVPNSPTTTTTCYKLLHLDSVSSFALTTWTTTYDGLFFIFPPRSTIITSEEIWHPNNWCGATVQLPHPHRPCDVLHQRFGSGFVPFRPGENAWWRQNKIQLPAAFLWSE